MNIGTIFENTNGNSYCVLAQKGNYTLVSKTNGGCQPFIVCWNVKEYENKYVWDSGNYFSELESALNCFNGK